MKPIRAWAVISSRTGKFKVWTHGIECYPVKSDEELQRALCSWNENDEPCEVVAVEIRPLKKKVKR